MKMQLERYFFYSCHFFFPKYKLLNIIRFFLLSERLLQCLDQHNLADGWQLNDGNLNELSSITF